MKYHLVALFTIFVWGFTFVSTKVLLVDLSPYGYCFCVLFWAYASFVSCALMF